METKTTPTTETTTRLRATLVLGTAIITITAWEPTGITGPHRTITTIEDQWFGMIGSECEDLDPIVYPFGSKARIQALDEQIARQENRARALILAQFPQAQEMINSGVARFRDHSLIIQFPDKWAAAEAIDWIRQAVEK